MMNINAIFTADAHEKGNSFVVKDIYGEDTDIVISMKGVHSKAWRKIVAERDRQFISTGGASTISDEEMLAEITTGWENMPNPKKPDEELKFSKKNAAMIYQKAPIIFEQANRFAGSLANFMMHSAEE